MANWKNRYLPSEIWKTNDCKTVKSSTLDIGPPKMFANVNKIFRKLLKNHSEAEIETMERIFFPLVESFPSLSKTKKARASKAPIVAKLERSAKNLLAVTSAGIISL
jgi:hypothetical protein